MIVGISTNERRGRRDLHVYLCSIDTRWAAGTHIGSGLPETDNMVVYGALKTRSPSRNSSSSWAPVPGTDWRFAATDRAWLDALLLLMGGGDGNGVGVGGGRSRSCKSTREQGWTTAAAMFAHAGLDNSTGGIDGRFASLYHTIESTVATIMVDDGLSRVGLGANHDNMHHVSPERYRLYAPCRCAKPTRAPFTTGCCAARPSHSRRPRPLVLVVQRATPTPTRGRVCAGTCRCPGSRTVPTAPPPTWPFWSC